MSGDENWVCEPHPLHLRFWKPETVKHGIKGKSESTISKRFAISLLVSPQLLLQ